MGLFQGIKDASFIAKCSAQIKHVLPDSAKAGEAFCTNNSHFFLAFRDKGHSFDVATHMTCLYLLDKRDVLMNDNLEKAVNTLVIASNYCGMFIARWPNSEYSPAFGEAVSKFIQFTKFDPAGLQLRERLAA